MLKIGYLTENRTKVNTARIRMQSSVKHEKFRTPVFFVNSGLAATIGRTEEVKSMLASRTQLQKMNRYDQMVLWL